jgi:hypothetical protein
MGGLAGCVPAHPADGPTRPEVAWIAGAGAATVTYAPRGSAPPAETVVADRWLSAPGSEAEARRMFSEAAYCPKKRVQVRLIDGTAPPPPAIARDAERLAMWRQAIQERMKGKGNMVVRAEGCGERTDFACFEDPGFDPVCMERSGALLLDGVPPSPSILPP